MEKTIICLANSRKYPSGRCIAGKEKKSLKWIRPISNRDTKEISEEERLYENGIKADLLDVIKISFKSHKPTLFQNENYLINEDYYWEKKEEYKKMDLHKICDTPTSLWINGYHKGYNCRNNCIPESKARDITSSLYLITPEELIIEVEKEWPGQPYGKRKVKAIFTYNSIQYIIPITDPKIEQQFLRENDDSYPIPNPFNKVFLCISLALPWDSDSSGGLPKEKYCYKLIAAVIGL